MEKQDGELILSIVIPAYNEEEAIASICERCIAAKPEIIAQTDVTDVEITVVSDGSWDKTAEIAAGYRDQGIHLIAYEKNRGYGAAIKTGYEASRGQLLSFLDADGTCDPLFFINLVNNLRRHNADISLGSRLGPQSQMPPIRVLGNKIFAFLLGVLSNKQVGDTASGMRVMTRDSLAKVYPLPDGLNFTPAMSARAMFDENIRIVEEPMTYKERIGKSKLSVVKDGWRFLINILDAALTYRPTRMLGMVSAVFLLIAALYGVGAVGEFFRGELDVNSTYRVITVMVLTTAAVILFLTGLLAERAIALTYSGEKIRTFTLDLWLQICNSRNLIVSGLLLIAVAFLLNIRALVEYVLTREIQVSWFVVATGGMLVLLGIQLIASGILTHALDLLKMMKEHRSRES